VWAGPPTGRTSTANLSILDEQSRAPSDGMTWPDADAPTGKESAK
jgi:hypothetical protein